MEAIEAILRGVWLAVVTHLWQTTLLWAALFAIAPLFRSAPGRQQELFWGTALVKLFVPLAICAPWAGRLVALVLGTSRNAGPAEGAFATIAVVADPLATVRARAESAQTWLGTWTVVTLLWIVGALVVLLRRGSRVGSPERDLCLDTAAPAVLAKIRAALAGTRIPADAIRVTEGTGMPAVRGVLRPRIVISARSVLALDEPDLRGILHHEDAHRRRRDPLRGALQRLALAVFFYYPPLWFVLRRLRSAAEFRCDESAAWQAGRPEEYASALARTLALGLRPARGHAAEGSSRPSLLRERFTRLSEPGRFVAMPKHRIALAASFALLGLVAFFPLTPRAASPVAFPSPVSRPAPPAQPPGVMTIDERVTAPTLVEKVSPVYPQDARLARAHGKVVLQAVIDAEGLVSSVEVLRGVPGAPSLSQAAMDAVRRWRYEPARLEGRPVPVYFTIVVNFFLDSETAEPFEGLAARDAIVTLTSETATLGEVLEILARDKGLAFAFLGDIPKDAPVVVDWQGIALHKALEDLSARYPLTLEVVDARTLAISWEKPGR